MLVFDLTVQLTVGSVFALGSRKELANDQTKIFDARAFRNGLLYSMFLYVPSAIFFLYVWPGWNSMYLFDIETERIYGGWFAFLDSVGLFGCYILGYWMTIKMLRKSGGKTKSTLVTFAIIWVVIFLFLFALLWDRSFTVTTYQNFISQSWPMFQFRWGEPDSFWGHSLMYHLILWCVIDFIPLIVIYLKARKKDKKLA